MNGARLVHCKENPIYVFLFWELHSLSPNFHIHVSVSDLCVPRIGPHISLQQNRQNDPGKIKISHRYMSVGTGRQNIIILFWKYQFHFCEYINGNQTFILYSYRPFICSISSEKTLECRVVPHWCVLFGWGESVEGVQEYSLSPTLIKKKIKFSSYIRKFRREQLQSHI
jgi:hypothetical protein